jgi:oligopeptidase B
MSIEGGSAGGLLIGAVLNMAPAIATAAEAGVPFARCNHPGTNFQPVVNSGPNVYPTHSLSPAQAMTTMCEPSIPLTCNEWEEWGNPNYADDAQEA